MNIFLFILIMLGCLYYFFRGLICSINATSNEEKWLREVYQPKRPNKFKIWLCKQRKHTGKLLHYIEGNQGTSKVRCLGCQTVFLEGRKIHIHWTKSKYRNWRFVNFHLTKNN